MPPIRLDPATAGRLLEGTVNFDDVPPGYGGAAQLLDAARSIDAAACARETATVAAMQAAMLETLHGQTSVRRRGRVLSKVLTLKVGLAASVFVAVLGGATAAAAADALPGPAQRVASEILAKVGISVPDDDDSDTPPSSSGGTSPNQNGAQTPGSGQSANTTPGQCSAATGTAGHTATQTSSPPPTTCATTAAPNSGHGTTSPAARPAGTSASSSGSKTTTHRGSTSSTASGTKPTTSTTVKSPTGSGGTTTTTTLPEKSSASGTTSTTSTTTTSTTTTTTDPNDQGEQSEGLPPGKSHDGGASGHGGDGFADKELG